MALRIQGFDNVNRELKRFAAQQRPALQRALQSTVVMGRELAVDAIYKRYGYADRAYVEQHLSARNNPAQYEARIIGRYRPSTISRFVTKALTRPSKTSPSRPVAAGLRVSVMRNKLSAWRTAFLFRGRSDNELVTVRYKGEKWRKIPRSLYGPSVAGCFAGVREDLEPILLEHLKTNFQRLTK